MRPEPQESTSTVDRIDQLVSQLTLEEQVSLLAGAEFWRAVPTPRLNIPALKVTDGPAGARGGGPLIGGKKTGGPVLLPWLDDVRAVLQAWFPCQEAGHAIADVLLGRAEPGGRLPQTFPARLEDDSVHPEHPDRQYPGEDGHVEYREGLYIGYRHVDRAGLTPRFPFGFGLSFTTFELGEPQLQADTVEPGGELTVTIPVRNTGERAGQTVIQLYVRDVEARLDRPSKELKAFAKVTLQPNQSQDVTLTLDMRALAYYDDTREAWVADAGDFDLLIGTSSADLPRTARVHLVGEWTQASAGARIRVVPSTHDEGGARRS